MNRPPFPAVVDVALDDGLLDLDSLCRATAVTPAWVHERVAAGLLQAREAGGAPATAQWRFDVVAVRRVRQMRRIERDFDAVPELAALVSDLIEEVAALRAQLRRR